MRATERIVEGLKKIPATNGYAVRNDNLAGDKEQSISVRVYATASPYYYQARQQNRSVQILIKSTENKAGIQSANRLANDILGNTGNFIGEATDDENIRNVTIQSGPVFIAPLRANERSYYLSLNINCLVRLKNI